VSTLLPWLPKLRLLLGGITGAWAWVWAKRCLEWASAHTGVPAIVVAAVLLVVLYRLAKRSLRFVAEVSLVLAVLLVLARLGFLRF
jgi:hypothetical protein